MLLFIFLLYFIYIDIKRTCVMHGLLIVNCRAQSLFVNNSNVSFLHVYDIHIQILYLIELKSFKLLFTTLNVVGCSIPI